jgi:hypothetical protein
MSHVVDPGTTRTPSAASTHRLATAIRAALHGAPAGPARHARVSPAMPARVLPSGRTQLDCPSWLPTAANATARQDARRQPPRAAVLPPAPAWRPLLPPLPLLEAQQAPRVTQDHDPASSAHVPPGHDRAATVEVHPRRLGLRSRHNVSTPSARCAPVPAPARATRPCRHTPLTGPWLSCPPPPNLQPASLALLLPSPLQQPQPHPPLAPSPGLSHHPTLLPNPRLAVGLVRTGLGRGDIPSRGGGVMGGVVAAQCGNAAGGSEAAVFPFFPRQWTRHRCHSA